MSGMDELVTWLRVQLDDEAWLFQHWPGDRTAVAGTRDGLTIARWTPAQGLAEVEAKRRILELTDHYIRKAAEDRAEGHPSRAVENIRDTYRSVLRYLAQPYAERPGYCEEWRP